MQCLSVTTIKAFLVSLGHGLDCLLDGIQRKLWPASYHCPKCSSGELEGEIVHSFLLKNPYICDNVS